MTSAASVWLVSCRFDLTVFLVPAVVALSLAALGPQLAPTGEMPVPMWFVAILMVDVAHVWSTIYRTYFDSEERARRRVLYVLAPLGAYVAGVLLHSISSLSFWRGLAYLAVWHFVRQQYGWVVLYNRRAGDTGRLDRWIDSGAIYASTLFPILWWHAHLPRGFEWFLKGDFFPSVVPEGVITFLWPLYGALLGVFVLRQAHRWVVERVVRPGKIILVSTTAICWGYGIIATNTDWTFTVTNVLIHGIPYMAIVWVYGERSAHAPSSFLAWLFSGRHVVLFYGLLVFLAYSEELAWDRLVWHDHPQLFPGGEVSLSGVAQALVVPLLALPQATHYVLDAFIWKTSRETNPALAQTLHLGDEPE